MSYLALSKITKRYGALTVVDAIDIEIEEGEFICLLGPSGCGKTTTLRMIAGFGEPTEGRIVLRGQEISSPHHIVPPEKRGMSMIFQSYAIWPNMTVAENVSFGLELKKLARAEIRRRVGEILEIVQMSHLADRYPAELSGGQQQRVALARSIVIQPAVLLLDEPLSNLDANLREEMRSEIRRLHEEFRITTVYVTHDQSEAMATADRIAVMNQGRIEQIDPPHVIYTQPRTEFVAQFIGRTNLLRASLRDGRLDFGSFKLSPSDLRTPLLSDVGEESLASLRPQGVTISSMRGGALGKMPGFAGKITSRVYLGEHWDYTVCAEDGHTTLKVSSSPLQVHEVGDLVWLTIDTRQVAIVGGTAAA